MAVTARTPAATDPQIAGTAYGKRVSATGAEQERRVAWGKQAGAQVAAAYRALQEGR